MKSAAETTLKTSQKTDRGPWSEPRGCPVSIRLRARVCVCVVGIPKKGRTLVWDRYLEE